MSVRNDFSQVSAVSPTASALTLQTRVSIPPSSPAAASTHCFNAAGSATSIAPPHDLTPFVANAFTTLPTSSALRAQMATLAPSSAKSSAIARPMPLLPPVTSALLPFNPRSMIASPLMMTRPASRGQAASFDLHPGPVACAFERRGGFIDRRLIVVFADQHQPDRQPIAHPAGNAHCRMTRSVERRCIGNDLECALDIELPRCVRPRNRRRLHRQGRHQQQIVIAERRIVGGAQLAVQVLRFRIKMTAIVFGEILAEQHRYLEAVGQLIGAVVPG